MDNLINYPAVPYIGPVYKTQFKPGLMVRILGTTTSFAYRFNINLQCSSKTSTPDIALQVSVILDGYVAFNFLQNGVWGEEKRGPPIPIRRADRFEIIILCEASQYMVAINDRHYCEFPQIIPHDRITHLAIDGDVCISQISYELSSGGPPDGFQMPTSDTSIKVPALPLDHKVHDFEAVNLNEHHPVPAVGFVQPHRDEAVLNNQRTLPPLKISAANAFSSDYNKMQSPASPGTPYPPLSAPILLNSTSVDSTAVLLRPHTAEKEGATYYLIILMVAIVLFFVVYLL